MINDDRFKDSDIVWAFQNPEAYKLPIGTKVKADSLMYYIELLRSSIWITNSSIERGLSIPKGNRFYINTWHGTPLKTMGRDIDKSRNSSFVSKGSASTADVFMAQGNFDAHIFERVYDIPWRNLALIGLPRNDELVSGNTPQNIQIIREKLGLPKRKKVILYAPTFREYDKDGGSNCVFHPPIDLNKWQILLGGEYVFLLRAHYEVVKILNLKESSFVKNVSAYPNLNDLILVSDLLISDYSSIFFDYSILGRPMIPYCYDYDKYSLKRGLYFDIREALSCNIKDEESLLDLIKSGNYEQYREYAVKFRDKYIHSYGDATSKTLDLIVPHLL